jgi:hypothetical protein
MPKIPKTLPPRQCARCGRPLKRTRANFCSPACVKATRAEVDRRPAAGRRLLIDGAPRAVYAGDERLGDVRERVPDGGRSEFVARDRLQRDISVHDSWPEAANAVVRRAWNGQ